MENLYLWNYWEQTLQPHFLISYAVVDKYGSEYFMSLTEKSTSRIQKIMNEFMTISQEQHKSNILESVQFDFGIDNNGEWKRENGQGR